MRGNKVFTKKEKKKKKEKEKVTVSESDKIIRKKVWTEGETSTGKPKISALKTDNKKDRKTEMELGKIQRRRRHSFLLRKTERVENL